MRNILERLYAWSSYLAGFCMVALLLMVLLGIITRILPFESKGFDAYAGYFMAASAFLALAHTQRRGEHIRVTLLLNRLSSIPKRWLELYCHCVGTLISALLTWFSIKLVWQSHTFHDVSQGIDATPLWIPQLVMVVGAMLLLVAFVDDLWAWVCGRPRELAEQDEIKHLE